MLRRNLRALFAMTCVISLAFLSGPRPVKAASAIRINEVGPVEATSDFIEFYVATGGNYASYTIYANTTSANPVLVKTFPSAWTSLSAGSFIVLHFDDSTADETTIDTNGNGAWDIYTTSGGLRGTDNTIFLSNSAGIVFSSGSYSSGTIVDFMCFANQDGIFPTQAVNNINSAVSAGQWSRLGSSAIEFDCANSRTAQSSIRQIARDNDSTDNESKYDWSVRTLSTMGAANGSSTTAGGLGTGSISPTTSSKGTTGTWTITYTAANPNNDTANHMILIRIPDGWTAPQTTSSSTAGYTTFSGSSYRASYPGVANGQFIIVPVGNMSNGGTITITYGDTSGSSSGAAMAPNSDATYAFRIQSDDTGTNVDYISSVPTVTVGSPTAVTLSSFTARADVDSIALVISGLALVDAIGLLAVGGVW